MKRNFVMIVIVGMILLSQAVFAEEPTVESAHEFLASVINKGSTIESYPSSYTKYDGDKCKAKLALYNPYSTKEQSEIIIDWSAVSEIKRDERSKQNVYVKGAIVNNGWVQQSATFSADSETMGERMAKAFELLRTKCDKSQKYGF